MHAAAATIGPAAEDMPSKGLEIYGTHPEKVYDVNALLLLATATLSSGAPAMIVGAIGWRCGRRFCCSGVLHTLLHFWGRCCAAQPRARGNPSCGGLFRCALLPGCPITVLKHSLLCPQSTL
jgi:hypothetical protein